MKHRPFQEPNFECWGELGEREERWVTYTADSDRLKVHLGHVGYKNVRVERFDFSEWLAEAEREATSLANDVAAGNEVTFKPLLWKRLKQHLFDLFDGNCAYCECKVLHGAYGEVEHYRPKRKPHEATDHPGYFWLAYTTLNLLPCCQACNGARSKATHFPVDGKHALTPAELPDERPLLLNPYLAGDDPRTHLEFLPPRDELVAISSVVGRSERGRWSVDIYNLQRPDLVVYRGDRQRKFLAEIRLADSLGDIDRRSALIDAAVSGREECSAACVAALQAWLEAREADNSKIRSQMTGR